MYFVMLEALLLACDLFESIKSVRVRSFYWRIFAIKLSSVFIWLGTFDVCYCSQKQSPGCVHLLSKNNYNLMDISLYPTYI